MQRRDRPSACPGSWGPLFLPAYLLAGAWQGLRGRRPYWDNPFEVEARRVGDPVIARGQGS